MESAFFDPGKWAKIQMTFDIWIYLLDFLEYNAIIKEISFLIKYIYKHEFISQII